MKSPLPVFAEPLLKQGRDPAEISAISAPAPTGWLVPLATRILSALLIGRPTYSFLAHGYTYLRVPSLDDHVLHLRMAAQSVTTPWPVDAPAVVKRLSHAAEELMPPPETWPAPAIPGNEPEESRPPTLEEYRAMRTYLIRHRLIG